MVKRRPKSTRHDDPPSPREYLRAVHAYTRELWKWLDGVIAEADRLVAKGRADATDVDEADRKRFSKAIRVAFRRRMSRMPKAPTAKTILTKTRSMSTRAVRGVRRSMLRAGVPHGTLAASIGEPSFTHGELVGTGLTIGAAEEAMLLRWAKANAKLIKSVRYQIKRDIPRRVLKQVQDGGRWEDVAKTARARLHVSRSRMRLIARDQTAKLNGQLTAHMHQRAGITHYRWRTSKDSRVRESHADLEGKVFAWDSDGAPGAGPYGQPAHPGQGIQCRCTAEPVVDVDELLKPPKPKRKRRKPKPKPKPPVPQPAQPLPTPEPEPPPKRVVTYLPGTEAIRPSASPFDVDELATGVGKLNNAEATRRQKRGQSATEAEAKVRQQINALLDEYDVVVSDLQDDFAMTDASRMTVAPKSWGPLGAHWNGGAMRLRRDVVNNVKAWKKGDRDPVKLRQGFHVMVHEGLHGASNIRATGAASTYRGAGAVIEEVTTEISARFITWDRFGKGIKAYHTDGGYQTFISNMIEDIDDVLKDYGAKIHTGLGSQNNRLGAWLFDVENGVPGFARDDTIAGMLRQASMAHKQSDPTKDGFITTARGLADSIAAKFPVPDSIPPHKVDAFRRDLAKKLMRSK